jgi:hypothetical protein
VSPIKTGATPARKAISSPPTRAAGRAAHEAQQGEVVDVAQRAGIQPEVPASLDREQAGAEGLLQRLAHAEIRCQ